MLNLLQKPLRTLILLVGLNIALDVLSIPIWIALLSISASPALLVGTAQAAIIDAVAASAVFSIAFFGLILNLKWCAYLAASATVGQRIVGLCLFSLNGVMAIEVLWSLLVVYFCYRVVRMRISS